MERKLKSPTKNLLTSRSKESQSKNTSPNGNIASKYQLRNLYVSLQRLPPSDVDKWKNCEQSSKTSVEINISQDSKNDNKMVKSRKSNNSTMKKVFDENKIKNFDDSSGTADSKNIPDTSGKQLSHLTEEDDEKSLSISRRSSLRNASANFVIKNDSPSTSNNGKSETLKVDPNVNISFSSDQNESKKLLETNLSPTKVKSSKIDENKLSISVTSSNSSLSKSKSKETENLSTDSNIENIVRNLRSKTINRSDESSLQSQKKLKTSNNENISTSESLNKLKRGLDEDESGSEHKVMSKKVKKNSESEDSLEKIGCNTSENSNPNNITELKSSRKMKSTLTKNISGTTSDTLNKSNNDFQKEKRKMSKESDSSEEEPRLLRSSTIKQSLSYDSKTEDKKSSYDNPKSPPIFDQNRCITKNNVEKDKPTSIDTSDEKKKSKQSSDGDLIEPRVLRSSIVKQVPSPSKEKLDIEDKNKNSDILFDDSPESPPVTEQVGSICNTKVVLIKETSSKKSVKSGIIRDPRKINNIVENPSISSKEIEQPSSSPKLKQISNTSNLESTDFEENAKIKKSSLSKIDSKTTIVSKTENETVPYKKEIPLFDPTLASKNIRTYTRKGKRKNKISNQFEIQDSSKVENEIVIDVTETSLENIQIDKSSINIVNPLAETDLDEIKDKLKVSDDPCSSVQEAPTVLNIKQEKVKTDKSPIASSGVEVNDKTLRTKKKVSIPKGSLKKTSESFADIKNKCAGSDESCNKATDSPTLFQISKLEKFISKTFPSSSFKDLSNVDDSDKKSTSSGYSSLSSFSETTVTVTEGDSSTKSNDITEIKALPTPKKLRKNSLNPCDDKKSVPALSPNITVSEKNESLIAEKRATNVSEDLNKLNSSVSSSNLTSQSQSPIVEIGPTKDVNTTNVVSKLSSSPSKNLTKPKSLKKKRNSVPSAKLSYPSELTNIDKNSLKDKTTTNTSNENFATQPTSAGKKDVNSKKDQLLKTDQGIIEKDSNASNANKISETSPAPKTNNDLIIEKVDSKESLEAKKLSNPKHKLLKTDQGTIKKDSTASNSNKIPETPPVPLKDQLLKTDQGIIEKDSTASNLNKTSEIPSFPEANNDLIENIDSKESLAAKKLLTLKHPIKRASKQESPSNKSNEFLELLPQATANSKKNFSVPVKKLSTPKQLSKRVRSKIIPSNEPEEQTQTTVDDLTKDKEDTEKDDTVLANQLPSSRQILKRAVKKETSSNITSQISKLPPTQPTNNDIIIENVSLKKDTPSLNKTLPKRKLSKSNERIVKEETFTNIGNQISNSPLTQATTNDVIIENVSIKQDTPSFSKTLLKKQWSKSNERIVKEESVPAQTASNDAIIENVSLKKDTPSPSKTLPKRQLSKSNERIVKEESVPAQTASNDTIIENVSLKKDTPSLSKTLPKRQLSKSNERIVKEETSSNIGNQISKSPLTQATTNDVIVENVSLKQDTPSLSKTLPKRKLSKSNERIVKEESVPGQPANNDAIMENVSLKKDSPSLSKTLPKRQLSKSNESIVKVETSTIGDKQVSKSPPSQTTSNDIIKENVGVKKDSPTPSKMLPKRRLSKSNESIGKVETSSIVAKQVSKSSPSQTTSNDIIKENVGVKKDSPTPSKMLPKKRLSKSNESIGKVDTSSIVAKQVSKSPPSQTTSNDITEESSAVKKDIHTPSKLLPKRQLSKSNESVVKVETSSIVAKQVSKSPPSQTTSNDIIEESSGMKKDSPTPSKMLTKRQLSKSNESIVKVETSSIVAKQVSKSPPSQTTSNDIREESNGVKKDIPTPSKMLPKRQLSKSNESIGKVDTSSIVAKQVSKSSPSQTTSNNIIKENVDVKKDSPAPSKMLPKRRLSKSNESIGKVDTSSMAKQVSKSSPNQTTSSDIIKESVDVKKDGPTPSKLLPKRQLSKSNESIVKVETSSIVAKQVSKQPPSQTTSNVIIKEMVDLKKDNPTPSKTLRKRKLSKSNDSIVKVVNPPIMANQVSKSPPTQTISTDAIKENNGVKKDIPSPSKTLPKKQLSKNNESFEKVEASSNMTNQISKSLPSETASDDIIKEDVFIKKDSPTPSKTLPKKNLSKKNKNFGKVVISTNISSEISKSSPTQTAGNDVIKKNVNLKKGSSSPSKTLPKKKLPKNNKNVVKVEISPNISSEISKSLPTQAARKRPLKRKVKSKKDTCAPSKKSFVREVIVIEEPSSNTSNKISTLPANEHVSGDLKTDEFDSNEDPTLSSEIEPTMEIVIIEEPAPNTSHNISTSPANEAACNDLKKDKIDSKKDPSLSSEKVPLVEIVVVKETSLNTSNEITTLPPAEATSNDLKKEKIDSKKHPSLSSEKLPSAEIIVVEEPSSKTSNESSTMPPTETACSALKKEKIDSNVDPSLLSEKVLPTEIVVVEESSSKTSIEITALPPTEATSSDLKKEKIDSNKDTSLSSEKVPSTKVVLVESSNSSNESSTLPPTEAASSDLEKRKIDSKIDPSLPSEKIPLVEIIVVEEHSSNKSNLISTFPPTETASSDLKKEKIDSKEDPSLSSEKVTSTEIVVVEEPSSNTSNEIAKLPPAKTVSSDFKKEKIDTKEDPSLSFEKVPPTKIVVVEEISSNTSNETSTLPPAETASSDLMKGKINSKEEKISKRDIVVVEKPSSNTSSEIAILLPAETVSSDFKKEKIDSKDDPSLSSEKVPPSKIVVVEEPSSNTSTEISTLPHAKTVSSDLKKGKINSKEDSSLPSRKISASEIVVVEEPSNTSNKIATLPPTKAASSEVKQEKIDSKEDSALPSEKVAPRENVVIDKAPSNTSNEIYKSQPPREVIRKNIDPVKNASLPTKKILSPSCLTESDKSTLNEKTSIDSRAEISKSLPIQVPSCNLIIIEHTSLPCTNIQKISTEASLSSAELSSQSQGPKIIKKVEIVTKVLKKVPKLPSPQLSRNELRKLIVGITGDVSLVSRNLSQSQLSRMYRAALYRQISNYKISRSVFTQTENNLINDSLKLEEKKRKLNQGRSSWPLTTDSLSTNHSSKGNHNNLQKTNSRSSNGQPLEKKSKLDQDWNSLPLSRNQTTQTNYSMNMLQKTNSPKSSFVVQIRSPNEEYFQKKRKIDQSVSTDLSFTTHIPKKIRKEENSSKPSSVIVTNERKENIKSSRVQQVKVPSSTSSKSSVIKEQSSSKSPVTICPSCRRCSYTPPSTLSNTDLLKEFYKSQKESSTNQTCETCNTKDNTNKITQKPNALTNINNSNKKPNKLTKAGLLSLRKQSIMKSPKNVRKNQPPMIIELVSPSFYRNTLKSSNYSSQINRTVSQAENLSLNSIVIKTEPIHPTDHVFKVPTKAPPRAKNKKNTKSETFLNSKANELEVGILVRTSLGLAIKTGRTVIIPKELPESIKFNLAKGLNKIYFRRKYIYDPNKSENVKESTEINNLQFDNDYLNFKSKYEKPILTGEKMDSGEDNELANKPKLSNKESPSFDNLTDIDIQKYRKAQIELMRMYDKKGHISPLTNDKIMSLLISHQSSKSDKGNKDNNVKLKTSNDEKIVTIKKSTSFDSKPTAEEILKISGHDGYCSKLPSPPYYELMKKGVPFSPKHYFMAMQRKKNSLNPDSSLIDLNNTNDNEINLLKVLDNNFPNEERFRYNLRTLTKSKLKSDKFNRTLKESIDNSLSPDDDSESDENETISDENNAEDIIRNSSETNNSDSVYQLDEYISELKRLDQSIINAAKNYRTSINVEQVNKDLRLIVPKDGYGKELPERPTEWFLKFVTKFRKLELWRLHNVFKVHDNLRRIESAKINLLEKMYEKLSGNSLNERES